MTFDDGPHPKNTPRLLDILRQRNIKATFYVIGSSVDSYPAITRTMRPPYGALLTRQRNMLHSEYGYPTILWDVDPLDWKRPGIAVVKSRILSGTKSGSIVLAHDLHSSTVDAMPSTLDGLLAKNYRFVTVSQLLAMKQVTSQ